MKTLISGGTLVSETSMVQADLLIENGQIAKIGTCEAGEFDQIVDATGLHVLPGIVDDQVHFREPGLTHKEDLGSGSRACAKGGITTYLEMPNTQPPTISQAALDAKIETAAATSCVNFGFYIGATPDNLSVLQTIKGTHGIKIFIGSSTGNLLVDDQIALERIFAETELPICAHCEDEATVRANAAKLDGGSEYAHHSQIRDHAAAIISTRRAVELAEKHSHRFHVLHVSTAQEVEFLKSTSDLITAEACPHHLFFNISDYDRLGSLVQINPSIKTVDDNQALWHGLLDGTITVIATDHAPHTLEEKRQPYPQSPSGLPAVENSLALMLNEVNNGRCQLEQVVRWMSSEPSRVWGLKRKGQLTVGYDADLAIVDLKKTQTIQNEDQLTKSRWSPWHGRELTGWNVRTIVGGKTVWADGTFDENVRGTHVSRS